MFIFRGPGHSWLGIGISYWKFRHLLKLSLFFLHEVISVFLLGLFTQLLELITARKTFLDIFKYLYWNRHFELLTSGTISVPMNSLIRSIPF